MKHTVDWTDDALSMLAAVWVWSPDRKAVTAAQAEIDRLLADDPTGHSQPVSEGLFAIDVEPLRVQFEKVPPRTIRVVSVSHRP